VTRRGPKPGAAVSGGVEVGKLGGRPPQSATLRLGGFVAAYERTTEGQTLRKRGTITAINRGVPREIVVTFEGGEELHLWV
jgi:hypothetical protein